MEDIRPKGVAESFRDEFVDALTRGAQKMRIEMTEGAAGLFFLYATRLLQENERTNLTAITDAKEMAVKHFLDSLAVLKADVRLDGVWMDVGAGAGFPGMALKLYRPELEMVFLDAGRKRVEFLSKMATEMSLGGIRVEHARAEEAGRNVAYRERFDRVVARAVARLDVLAELTLPLVRPGGVLIAWKGPNADEEVREAENAIAQLGGGGVRVYREALPFGMGERGLVIVTKRRETPTRYPRRAGVPGRRPLGGRNRDSRT